MGRWTWGRLEDCKKAVVKMIEATQARACKYCGSYHVVRFGRYRGIQRLFCKDCRHKFVDGDALPGMKTPKRHVAAALSLYYKGMSLNAIRRQLAQDYNNYPSDSTVYAWVQRVIKKAVQQTKGDRPKVGDVWVADETVLKIGGRNVWFWDIIDVKTRFLLASHMSSARTARDAKALMERASTRAGKAPKVVLTDKLQAYLDGVELAFGAETKHIPVKGLTAPINTNVIERSHGTLKDRTKVMRGLKKPGTAELITEGWLVHYNYFRPHEALGNRTPAMAAGLETDVKDWDNVVELRDATFDEREIGKLNHFKSRTFRDSTFSTGDVLAGV